MGQALVLYNCQCISDMCLEIENFWLASQRNPMPKLITFLYNNMSSFLSFTICICLKFYVANNISKNSDQLQYSSTWGMKNILRLISILVVCISGGDCLVNKWVDAPLRQKNSEPMFFHYLLILLLQSIWISCKSVRFSYCTADGDPCPQQNSTSTCVR